MNRRQAAFVAFALAWSLVLIAGMWIAIIINLSK
jgi:hypothetical protein